GGRSNRKERTAAALVAPPQLADRTFKIDIELRREVMLDEGRDRPRGRLRPLVGYRVEEGVLHIHRLAVAVDLAVLAPHHVGETRVPDRALGVGTGDQEIVARAPEITPRSCQVELHAGVNAPADLVALSVAGHKIGDAA